MSGLFFILDNMKTFTYLIIYSSFLFLFYSCSIEEEFSFNKDYSGHYSFEFDYSALLSLDTTGSAGVEMSKGYDEMELELKKIEGISNILIKSDDVVGNVSVSYDFSSIDAINQANYDNENQRYTKFFTLNGNKIHFISDFSKELDEYKDPSMDATELLNNIESFVEYTMTIRFEKNIKVIDLQNFKKIDDHTLSFTLDEESLTEESTFNVKVK